jgi:hypothetical protein
VLAQPLTYCKNKADKLGRAVLQNSLKYESVQFLVVVTKSIPKASHTANTSKEGRRKRITIFYIGSLHHNCAIWATGPDIRGVSLFQRQTACVICFIYILLNRTCPPAISRNSDKVAAPARINRSVCEANNFKVWLFGNPIEIEKIQK